MKKLTGNIIIDLRNELIRRVKISEKKKGKKETEKLLYKTFLEFIKKDKE